MDWPVVIAIGAALTLAVIGGLMTPIGSWYAALRKPRWNPPNWVFGPAWGIILSLWSWAAALAWRGAHTPGAQANVAILFGVNALFHALWSPLFFKLRRPDLALIEVVFLWTSLLILLIDIRQYSPLASWLIVPYFVWVSFAACLNATIVRRNPAGR